MWPKSLVLLSILVYISVFVSDVEGHGRLMDPPSRASMWRMGYKTPKNYNDNQLYCGGYTRQWSKMKGKCGICGDPYDGPREHEAGGKYANGIIVKTYRMGQIIEAKVDITANHKGNFQFKICPNNDAKKRASQQCLDRYPLMAMEQHSYKYMLPNQRRQMFKVQLKLPDGLTCNQCVLQWVYTAGNNWGVCENGKGKVGCGPQEQFRGCADVAIVAEGSQTNPIYKKPETQTHEYQPDHQENGRNHQHGGYGDPYEPTNPKTVRPRPFIPRSTRRPMTRLNPRPYVPRSTRRPTFRPGPKYSPKPYRPRPTRRPVYQVRKNPNTDKRLFCKSVGVWKTVPGMTRWCKINCAQGYCPSTHCYCS